MSILSVWFAIDYDPSQLVDLVATAGVGVCFGMLMMCILVQVLSGAK
jgi:hypothetical protein